MFRSTDHLGFALCVKMGLELCTTTYVLVAQHDRCFAAPFHHLHTLIESMERYDYIRYIGFPTSRNITHDRVISSNYHLNCLTYNRDLKHELIPNSLYLQPLIFWFDSQHLCHRERYLKIFTPYKTFPVHIRDLLGGVKVVKDMFLKPGDFIEDKFGQQQRNCLISLKEQGYADEIIIELFKWYGSYLCWVDHQVSFTETTQHELGPATTLIMVRHLHGRGFCLERLLERIQEIGIDRIKNKRYLEIFNVDWLEEMDNLENTETVKFGGEKG